VSADSLERAFRDERGPVLATITRRLDGNLALAEDVVQDAFVAAAVEWDRGGVPERPGAWLTTTAWRKALDRLRHEKVAAEYAPQLVHDDVGYDEFDFDASSLEDDQLRMLFTCCHPALPPEALHIQQQRIHPPMATKNLQPDPPVGHGSDRHFRPQHERRPRHRDERQ